MQSQRIRVIILSSCLCTSAAGPSSSDMAPAGYLRCLPGWISGTAADVKPEMTGRGTPLRGTGLHLAPPTAQGPMEAPAKREKLFFLLNNKIVTVIMIMLVSLCFSSSFLVSS